MPSEKPPRAAIVQLRHFAPIAIWALVLGVCLYFLGPVRVLLLGILAAGAMACALHPLSRFIPARRWVRAAVVGILPIFVTLGVMLLLGYLLSTAIAKELQQWPQIQSQLDATLRGWSEQLGLKEPLTVSGLVSQSANLLTGQGGLDIFSTTTTFLGSALVALAFLFFGSIFFLGEKPQQLLAPILLLAPAGREQQVREAFIWLVPRLRWWVIGTLISVTVVGVVSGIGYRLAGLKMAWAIGLLAGLGELVPTFGPVATFLVALVLAAAEGPRTIAGVLIAYLVVQMLESYVLTPYVMKRAAEVPPIVTLLTIVLWGQVFGLAGLFLAIPINLVIWSFADHLLLKPRAAQRQRPS